VQSGRLSIEGPDGRDLQVTVLPDNAPGVEITGEVMR